MTSKELKLNETYFGFKFISKEYVEEIKSTALIFEHLKTKAKILKLQNNETENSFSISFKTPSTDSTGMQHIMEHSVLNGSKKYPLRDPFATLAKSTINSFLNAFTWKDKTAYAFSSSNKKDFFKLLDVYLDAVFNPKAIENKKIFLQEGWRYTLDENNKLKYDGIVYNEMKGVYSSVNNLIEEYTLSNLFPETEYSFDSGGNPKEIPNLTYESFIAYYKKHYHPTNSKVYFYGNNDILEELKFLEENFFSNYSYSNPAPKTKLQEPFNSPKEKEIEYPVIGNPENKYYYIYSFALSKSTEIEEVIGLEILNEILFEMNASPIKKALNEAELGEDIYTTLENENLQTILTLVLVNSNAENKEKFKDILFENLEKLSKKIDKNLVLSAINKVEFQFKELIDYEDGFTKGLLIWRNIMKSWLHETDEPLKQIKTNKIFENIRNSKNYFEKLITKYLLENKHSCFITLKPNPELNEHEKELEKLKQIQKNLTPEELNEIKTQTKQMEKYLSEVKNDSLLMPCLDPKEISSKQKKIEFEEKTISEIKIKNYLANTNQITYVNFFFDINNLSFEEYQYVSLLAEMLEKTKTQNYTEVEISNLVNTYTGGIDFSIIPLETKNRELKILFLFSTKFLDLNSEKIPEIITEILNNAKFEIKKIKEVLKEIKSDLSLGLIESGHITAITRNESNFSKLGKVNEHISGITYYEFCKKLLDIFDGNKIKSKLEEIYSKIFSKENLILNVNSENKNFEKIIPKFELKSKSEITTDKTEIKINLEKKSEGICANSQVNYVTLGANIKDLEFEFNANYLILKNYLRYDYLWNTIRAKYGAYGAGAKITKNGNFTFFSFRDPNIKESLKVYENLPVELENFNLTKEEYDRLIIGTISDYEKEHDPNEKALRALFREFLGYTHADIEKEKSEILNSNINEMKKLAKPVVEIIKQNNLCVLGNEKKIKENKERFEEIINLD